MQKSGEIMDDGLRDGLKTAGAVSYIEGRLGRLKFVLTFRNCLV